MQLNGELDRLRSLPESEWRVMLFTTLKQIDSRFDRSDKHFDEFAKMHETHGKEHECQDKRIDSLESWRDRLTSVFTFGGWALGSGGIITLAAWLWGIGR